MPQELRFFVPAEDTDTVNDVNPGSGAAACGCAAAVVPDVTTAPSSLWIGLCSPSNHAVSAVARAERVVFMPRKGDRATQRHCGAGAQDCPRRVWVIFSPYVGISSATG